MSSTTDSFELVSKSAVELASTEEGSNTPKVVHFPPAASSTGRRYYAFTTPTQRQGSEAYVVCGWNTALVHLGGTWSGRGRAPRGFAELYNALEFIHQQFPEQTRVEVIFDTQGSNPPVSTRQTQEGQDETPQD